jgi:5-methylcytosine-specific restriction endonuclease McrA
MESTKLKQLKINGNYFIHEDGYVFKKYKHIERIIEIKVKKGVPTIFLNNKTLNFIFLMEEYFGDNSIVVSNTSNVRFSFKKIGNNYPYRYIKKIENKSKVIEDYRLVKFKCLEKSRSANSRVLNNSTISEFDVYNSLVRVGFNCTYCNCNLNSNTWELDHFEPISKGGLNDNKNITPSCKKCNRMKGALPINDYLHKIFLTYNNFKDSTIIDSFTSQIKAETNKAKGGSNG